MLIVYTCISMSALEFVLLPAKRNKTRTRAIEGGPWAQSLGSELASAKLTMLAARCLKSMKTQSAAQLMMLTMLAKSLQRTRGTG